MWNHQVDMRVMFCSIIIKNSPEKKSQEKVSSGCWRYETKYPIPTHVYYFLFIHITQKADENGMPWLDPTFDSSSFIVILIIINHLNMLAKLNQ